MSRLLQAVLVLAVVCVARVAAEEADEHDADTPIRQAQRAMLLERESATAVHAHEDVLGMRMMAVSEGETAPHPEARRISGAADSFSPNDKMCVMCQFLTQRIQQDLALGYGGSAFGGSGMPPFAMIAAVPPVGGSFMEMGDDVADEELVELDSEDEAEAVVEDEDEAEDEEEVEDEAEDEEEAEDEVEDEAEAEAEEEAEDEIEDEAEAEFEAEEAAEEEAEDESEAEEDSVLLQVEDETESEWVAPEYASAEAAPQPALIEAGADFQTPTYVNAPAQNAVAEEEEQEEEEAAGTDSAEPTFFESEALASKAAEEDWVTPEFTAEPVANVETVPAELSLLQTGENEEDGEEDGAWQTPAYSDAMASTTGAKAYARVIVPAHKELSLIEATAEATVSSGVSTSAVSGAKLFAPRIVASRRARRGLPVIFHTQKRYRAADAVVPRPRWHRMDAHTHHHAQNRLIAGSALRNAEHAAYDRLEAYCSTRLPESYGKFCRPVLRMFRRITEGLSYGDKVERVCMAVNLCQRTSYVAQSPHVKLDVRN